LDCISLVIFTTPNHVSICILLIVTLNVLKKAVMKSKGLLQILFTYRHGNPKTLTIKQILVHFIIHS